MVLIGLAVPEPLLEAARGWCEAAGFGAQWVCDDAAATRCRAAGYPVVHLLDRPLRQWRGPLSSPLALEVRAGDWVAHCPDTSDGARRALLRVLGEMTWEGAA